MGLRDLCRYALACVPFRLEFVLSNGPLSGPSFLWLLSILRFSSFDRVNQAQIHKKHLLCLSISTGDLPPSRDRSLARLESQTPGPRSSILGWSVQPAAEFQNMDEGASGLGHETPRAPPTD